MVYSDMSWVIFAFSSVFLFTALNLLQRVLSVESNNPRAMSMLYNSIAAILAIILLIFTEGFHSFTVPSDPKAWIVLCAVVVFYGLFERGRFIAAQLLDASTFITIMNVCVMVAFIASAILYAEPLTFQKLLGAGLIITAIMIVSFKRNPKKSPRSAVFLGIGISIVLGLGWSLDKLGTGYFTPGGYSFLIWSLPLLLIYLPNIKFDDIRSEAQRLSWKIVILAGLNVLGYWMQLRALELTEATRVIPIVQTSIILTIVLGIFVLDEKDNIFAKMLAGVMAFAGTYFLV